MAFNRKEYQKKYYTDNKEALKEKARLYHTDKRMWLLRGAQRRAKQAGLPYNLDVSDLVIPDKCPILQVAMVPKTRYAPTLDRRDPKLGYTKDNVWVVSKLANQMKSDATLEEQRKFAEWVKTL